MNATIHEKETGLFVPGEVKSTEKLLETQLNTHKLCLSRFFTSRTYYLCTVSVTGLSLVYLSIVAAFYHEWVQLYQVILASVVLQGIFVTDLLLRAYRQGVAFIKDLYCWLDVALVTFTCVASDVWIELASPSLYFAPIHFLPVMYSVKRLLSLLLPTKQPQTPAIRIHEDSFNISARRPYFEEHKESDGPASVEELN